MTIWSKLSLASLLMLAGCASQSDTPLSAWQQIEGRDHSAVYRARIPDGWRIEAVSQNLDDTTLPIASYVINGTVRVVVHNFPADQLEERIPPAAQLARWKRQLGISQPTESVTSPVSHGGFVGLQLKADGLIAWAMQLAEPHFRSLQLPGTPEERAHYRQMRADYTIKVTGPQDTIADHEEALAMFANSFELIEEIPSPL